VDWVDDRDSRVDVAATALADLKGIWRVGRALATGRLPLAQLRRDIGREPLLSGVPPGLGTQLARFTVIGVASTLAYLVLYALLRAETSAQSANLFSLLVTAIANTVLNRRITFGVRGPARAVRDQAQGLLIFAVGLALTSGSLDVLYAVSAHPSRVVELAVLTAANLTATVLRFLLLRSWVFGPRRKPPD
jgi:putative flippase GtrA